MGDEYSREKFSKLISILYFYIKEEEEGKMKIEFLKELKENLKNKSESMMHGSILTFGNISSLYFKKNLNLIKDYDENYFISLLDYHKPLVQYAACNTLGEMGKYGKFSNTSNIIQLLKKKLNSKNVETKLQEKIITTLGFISLNQLSNETKDDKDEKKEQDENLISILEIFFELSDNKAEEIHFTIGEALSMICGGFEFSDVSKDEFFYLEMKKQQEEEEKEKKNDFLTFTLKKLIKEGVLSPKKIVRFSSSIWLLTLIKHCSNHPDLSKYANDLQQAFTLLLSDVNRKLIFSSY